MKRHHIGLFLATVILASGCYSLLWTSVVYTTPTTWTGSGRGTIATSSRGRAVGLAGQRMVMFMPSTSDGYGNIVLDNPLGSLFGGAPYVLRGYTQTLGAYGHQLNVLAARRTTETGGLDLFVQSGIPSIGGWGRVSPSQLYFVEHGVDAVWWYILDICDIAAITESDDVPSDRIFASVRAERCGHSCSSPYAAVVEIELRNLSSHTPTWRVVHDGHGLGNATVRDENGFAFSGECMPIDVTTGYGDQIGHRLVVADPSADAILMYDPTQLRAGPIDVIRSADSTRSPVDVAILGDRHAGVDYVFVAALWRGTGTPQLRHYNGTLGALSDTPHLTETMSSDVRLVQGELQGVTTTPAPRASLYTLGSSVLRRTYEH